MKGKANYARCFTKFRERVRSQLSEELYRLFQSPSGYTNMTNRIPTGCTNVTNSIPYKCEWYSTFEIREVQFHSYFHPISFTKVGPSIASGLSPTQFETNKGDRIISTTEQVSPLSKTHSPLSKRSTLVALDFPDQKDFQAPKRVAGAFGIPLGRSIAEESIEDVETRLSLYLQEKERIHRTSSLKFPSKRDSNRENDNPSAVFAPRSPMSPRKKPDGGTTSPKQQCHRTSMSRSRTRGRSYLNYLATAHQSGRAMQC